MVCISIFLLLDSFTPRAITWPSRNCDFFSPSVFCCHCAIERGRSGRIRNSGWPQISALEFSGLPFFSGTTITASKLGFWANVVSVLLFRGLRSTEWISANEILLHNFWKVPVLYAYCSPSDGQANSFIMNTMTQLVLKPKSFSCRGVALFPLHTTGHAVSVGAITTYPVPEAII